MKNKTPGWHRTLAILKHLNFIIANAMILVNGKSPLFDQIVHSDSSSLDRYERALRTRVLWFSIAVFVPVLAFVFGLIAYRHF